MIALRLASAFIAGVVRGALNLPIILLLVCLALSACDLCRTLGNCGGAGPVPLP
jgi:hypothetical protein